MALVDAGSLAAAAAGAGFELTAAGGVGPAAKTVDALVLALPASAGLAAEKPAAVAAVLMAVQHSQHECLKSKYIHHTQAFLCRVLSSLFIS